MRKFCCNFVSGGWPGAAPGGRPANIWDRRCSALAVATRNKTTYIGTNWKELHKQGAVLYVCGDAAGMSAGVRQALVDIVCQPGQRSPEQAQEFLAQLVADRRYQLDVWASS